jgi:hypothetical protein
LVCITKPEASWLTSGIQFLLAISRSGQSYC